MSDAFPLWRIAKSLPRGPLSLSLIAASMGDGEVAELVAVNARTGNEVFDLRFIEDNFLKTEWAKA